LKKRKARAPRQKPAVHRQPQATVAQRREDRAQIAPAQQLEHHVRAAFGADVDHLDDVRMAKRRRNARLVAKHRHEACVLRQLG